MKLETLSKLAETGPWWAPIAGLFGAIVVIGGLSCLIGSIQDRLHREKR